MVSTRASWDKFAILFQGLLLGEAKTPYFAFPPNSNNYFILVTDSRLNLLFESQGVCSGSL